ncbi:MAG: DUF1214 domain-containing protein [Anderseniella sp.]
MMNLPIKLALSVLIGSTFGLGSASYMTSDSSGFFASKLGHWYSWPVTSGSDSNPYVLARYISNGHLPEHFSEVLSFYRTHDDDGNRLSEDCTYVLSMKRPSARRWSVSATVGATDAAETFLKDTVISRAGIVEISISATPQPGNWLAISDDDNPVILFRMYDSDSIAANAQGDNQQLELPSITLGDCS